MESKKKLLVVARDEIQLYCAGIMALLQQEEAFQVEIREKLSEISPFPSSRPDLILAFPNATMPSIPVKAKNLCKGQAKLLLICGPNLKYTMRHLQDLDADGIISSRATRSELILAVNTLIVKRLKYISPLLIDTLAQPQLHQPWSSLSTMEKYIALFLTNGKRNIDIAAELCISPKTVNTYKSRIYRKLGVSNSVQLLKQWQNDVLGEDISD